MKHVKIRAFIQGRMSSARFPGKVLAPLGERPLVANVMAAPVSCKQATSVDR